MHAGGATVLTEVGVIPALIQAAGRWSSDTFNRYIQKNVFLFEALLIGQLSSLPTSTSNTNVSQDCNGLPKHTHSHRLQLFSSQTMKPHTFPPLPSSYGLLAVHVLFFIPNFKSGPKLALGSLLSLLKTPKPCAVHLQATQGKLRVFYAHTRKLFSSQTKTCDWKTLLYLEQNAVLYYFLL